MNTDHLLQIFEQTLAIKPMLTKAKPDAVTILFHSTRFDYRVAEIIIGKPLKEAIGPFAVTADVFSFDFAVHNDKITLYFDIFDRGRSVFHANYGTFLLHGFFRNSKIRKLKLFDTNKVNNLTKGQ